MRMGLYKWRLNVTTRWLAHDPRHLDIAAIACDLGRVLKQGLAGITWRKCDKNNGHDRYLSFDLLCLEHDIDQYWIARIRCGKQIGRGIL